MCHIVSDSDHGGLNKECLKRCLIIGFRNFYKTDYDAFGMFSKSTLTRSLSSPCEIPYM